MIRRAYLQALEDDEHAGLPGAVYTKGFIRNYATYLGLDASNVLSIYHREYPDKSQHIVGPATIKPHGAGQLVTGGTVAGALLIVVLSVFSVYIYRQVQAFRLAQPSALAEALVPTPTPIPATPIGSTGAPSPTAALAPPTATPVPSGAEVTAKISQDAWLQVMVDGQRSFEGTLKAGQSQTWKGKDDVFIWAGNAGGVSIVFNGEDIGTLGAKGQIVKKDFKI
jgi:cytoskeletal protein RodZ